MDLLGLLSLPIGQGQHAATPIDSPAIWLASWPHCPLSHSHGYHSAGPFASDQRLEC
jgi:hypothetical protein